MKDTGFCSSIDARETGREYSLKTRQFHIALLPRQAYHARFTSDVPSIGFVFDSQQGVHALGGDRRSDFYAAANSMAYLPAACDVFSESERGGEYLKVSGIHHLLLGLGSNPFSGSACAEVIAAVNSLRRLLLTGVGSTHPEVADQAIVDWISCIEARGKKPPAKCMPRTRMQHIEAYIHQHLGEPLDVFTLASAFGQSPGYFSREFRKAFGQSPYNFIIERRVSSARLALTHSQDSITSIALEHGFSSHAHMCAVFKRRLGITPGLIR